MTVHTKGLPFYEAYKGMLSSPDLKAFIANVLKVVDADKFMDLFTRAVNQRTNGHAIYIDLLREAPQAMPFLVFRRKLESLSGDRNALAADLRKVIDPLRPKNGYVEITMPGRMVNTMKSLGVQGEITVINENEDRVQSGLLSKPYQKFVELEYEPLKLAAGSVDVISLFAGAHHCPPEKLTAFLKSIHTALSTGGIFLLRDHDADTPHMKNLACVIHSVFNACYGVAIGGASKPDTEMGEVRNFKSIKEWVALIEEIGFKHIPDAKPLIREGDSTKNQLLKFVKITKGNDAENLAVTRETLITEKPNYTRPFGNTFQTTVEWFNVESTRNLGSTTFDQYPYFGDVIELWKCYGNSWYAAHKLAQVKFTEHTFMNTVILGLMTVEYVAKGILCGPIAFISKFLPERKDDSDWGRAHEFYQNWQKAYAKKLDTVPYYAQSFAPEIWKGWSYLATEWTKARKTQSLVDMIFNRSTLRNVATGVFNTFDMLARASIAVPINWFFGGAENGDDREIGVIYKQNGEYKHHVAPRYHGLTEYLRSLGNVEIVEIAGQTKIQLDVVVDVDTVNVNESFFERLYERRMLSDPSKKIIALLVDLAHLPQYLRGDKIYRICDF